MESAPTEFAHLPPPPPYTPQDDFPSALSPANLSSLASNSDASSIRTSIRGGYVRTTPQREEPSLSSATAYFEERPCPIQYPSFVMEQHLVFPPDVTREGLVFPEPAERYRARDVRTTDWDTFVNYLLSASFPASHEKPGSSQERKDPSERYARIAAVIAQWNEGFFGPRRIQIYPAFVSAQAPAYRSTTSLPAPSAVSMPPQPIQHPQPYNKSSQDRHVHGHSRQQRRSYSVSSSSSSSSSSSASSISTISSKDLEGISLISVSQTLNRFRLSLATTASKDLKQTFRQLRSDLRAQRRAIPRNEFKAGFHAHKREIKAEIKSFKHELKAARRSARKARKTERKSRRAERRAEKHGRKDRERRRILEVGAQERAKEAEVRTREFEMRAMEDALDAEARGMERDMRAREAARDADELLRERMLEANGRAREMEARAREKAREAEARAREEAGGGDQSPGAGTGGGGQSTGTSAGCRRSDPRGRAGD